MDIFDRARRSALMASIRSRGNKDTELVLLAVLRAGKITGWRRHVAVQSGGRSGKARLKVRPDFVFTRHKVVIFVDGCFWHGCPWHHRPPTSNITFWRQKITGNRQRDQRNARWLRRAGWKVVRIWEHSLRHPDKILARINTAISTGKPAVRRRN